MSLYNMLFGQNPLSDVLLAMLDLSAGDVGRFRDCYLSEAGDRILVYTRNGGGNREHYEDDVDPGIECRCTGCIITYHLHKHPNYICDRDDDFDCTYATIEYSVPEQWQDVCASLATGEKPETVHEKFKEAIDKLKNGDPEMLEKGKKIAEPIIEALHGAIKATGKEE